MAKYLYSFLLSFLVSSAACAADDNVNAWRPSQDIPNIHLVELYTFHGLPKNTKPDREIKVLVNHGYAVGYLL